MNKAILVFGLPGTGKTYFSRHLAEETGAVHLNTDQIREKWNKKGQYDEKTKQFVYDKLMDEMIHELRNENDVIIDGTFYEKSKREQFVEKALTTNPEIRFIEIRAREEVVRERLRTDRAYSEADFKVYRKIQSIFEPFVRPHLVLWSTNDNIRHMIQEAKKYIYG